MKDEVLLMTKSTRINREKETVKTMIKLYCTDHHTLTLELCRDCDELLQYAHTRLELCKFGENKGVCADCSIHCYKKEMREKIQGIMRYSGPRMVFSHPMMALQHIIDRRKNSI
jgi:hypothetical protein